MLCFIFLHLLHLHTVFGSVALAFPPPPGLLPEYDHPTATLPHVCITAGRHQEENQSRVLCLRVNGLKMESEFVVSNNLSRLLHLLDQMIGMNYNLAKCTDSTDSAVNADGTIEETPLFDRMLSTSVAITDDSVVGLIDICVDTALCGSVAVNDVQVAARSMGTPIFTEISVVEAAVLAWKNVLIASTCNAWKNNKMSETATF